MSGKAPRADALNLTYTFREVPTLANGAQITVKLDGVSCMWWSPTEDPETGNMMFAGITRVGPNAVRAIAADGTWQTVSSQEPALLVDLMGMQEKTEDAVRALFGPALSITFEDKVEFGQRSVDVFDNGIKVLEWVDHWGNDAFTCHDVTSEDGYVFTCFDESRFGFFAWNDGEPERPIAEFDRCEIERFSRFAYRVILEARALMG